MNPSTDHPFIIGHRSTTPPYSSSSPLFSISTPQNRLLSKSVKKTHLHTTSAEHFHLQPLFSSSFCVVRPYQPDRSCTSLFLLVVLSQNCMLRVYPVGLFGAARPDSSSGRALSLYTLTLLSRRERAAVGRERPPPHARRPTAPPRVSATSASSPSTSARARPSAAGHAAPTPLTRPSSPGWGR